jgi:LPPG:FO 2-phospho-L-lactate transferase
MRHIDGIVYHCGDVRHRYWIVRVPGSGSGRRILPPCGLPAVTIAALCGGVGGAKLALGLYRTLPRDELSVVVNTGDDFRHLGLSISPDLDTVLYTLANLENPEQGWGRRDETWSMMRVLETLGAETWFRLGDGDLAFHIIRTLKMSEGAPLSAVIHDFRQRLGITAAILPMSDSRVETRLDTDAGDLGFQEYFVRRRCNPRVHSIRYEGAAAALPAPGVLEALSGDALEAIIVCPSNPYLSIDPMLAVPAVRAALCKRRVPVIVVSPLIGGKAVKGPTAKIMAELGVDTSTQSIFEHYRGLADALVIDACDASVASHIPMPVFATNTLMVSLEDRLSVARFVLDRIGEVARPNAPPAACPPSS